MHKNRKVSGVKPPLSTTAPPFIPYVCQCVRGRADKPQSAPAVQNDKADFTVVDRKKKRKVSTERHESKQQAQRGTGVNIDCRWAPPGIAKLWVSLPKLGAAITTISRRITKIISECRLPEITTKKRQALQEWLYNTLRYIWFAGGNQDTF